MWWWVLLILLYREPGVYVLYTFDERYTALAVESVRSLRRASERHVKIALLVDTLQNFNEPYTYVSTEMTELQKTHEQLYHKSRTDRFAPASVRRRLYAHLELPWYVTNILYLDSDTNVVSKDIDELLDICERNTQEFLAVRQHSMPLRDLVVNPRYLFGNVTTVSERKLSNHPLSNGVYCADLSAWRRRHVHKLFSHLMKMDIIHHLFTNLTDMAIMNVALHHSDTLSERFNCMRPQCHHDAVILHAVGRDKGLLMRD